MNTAGQDDRRLMTLCVPRARDGASDSATFAPVSFGIVDEGLLTYRLVDGSGRIMDLSLNHVVADALADCIALRHRWPTAPRAPDPEG